MLKLTNFLHDDTPLLIAAHHVVSIRPHASKDGVTCVLVTCDIEYEVRETIEEIGNMPAWQFLGQVT